MGDLGAGRERARTSEGGGPHGRFYLPHDLQTQQTGALLEFAAEHNLCLANSYNWNYEGCRPPGNKQTRPQAWTWAWTEHGERSREAQMDFVLLPRAWQQGAEVWPKEPVKSDHYPVWGMWNRPLAPWTVHKGGKQMTGWRPPDRLDLRRYRQVVDQAMARAGQGEHLVADAEAFMVAAAAITQGETTAERQRGTEQPSPEEGGEGEGEAAGGTGQGGGHQHLAGKNETEAEGGQGRAAEGPGGDL